MIPFFDVPHKSEKKFCSRPAFVHARPHLAVLGCINFYVSRSRIKPLNKPPQVLVSYGPVLLYQQLLGTPRRAGR